MITQMIAKRATFPIKCTERNELLLYGLPVKRFPVQVVVQVGFKNPDSIIYQLLKLLNY